MCRRDASRTPRDARSQRLQAVDREEAGEPHRQDPRARARDRHLRGVRARDRPVQHPPGERARDASRVGTPSGHPRPHRRRRQARPRHRLPRPQGDPVGEERRRPGRGVNRRLHQA